MGSSFTAKTWKFKVVRRTTTSIFLVVRRLYWLSRAHGQPKFRTLLCLNIVYIPRKTRQPTNLRASRWSLNSIGLGYRMERTRLPLVVAKPSKNLKKMLRFQKLQNATNVKAHVALSQVWITAAMYVCLPMTVCARKLCHKRHRESSYTKTCLTPSIMYSYIVKKPDER